MVPTTRLALAVGAVALTAFVLPPAAVAIVVLGLVAAGVADALVGRRLGPLVIEVPPTVARAAPAAVRVVPERPHPGRLDLRLPAPADVRVEPFVAEGALEGTVTAARRGRHVLEPVAARAEGPLGLGAWHHRRGPAHDLVVFPDLPGARRLAAAVREGRLPDGRRRGLALGLGTEFELVRDYSPDDDIRQVNWRATARVGRPMSNQYRLDQDRDVLLLVDAGRLLRAPAGDGATLLDRAIDAACAVAAVTEVVGDRVGVLAFDDGVVREAAPRRRGARMVAQAIFDVEPTPRDSDYRRAFTVAARRKRSLLLLFTDLLEESASAPLLESLPIVARRHAVVVASAADPLLRAALATPPDAVRDVLRAAVAADALDARRRVAARLAASGVQVLEAPPAGLAGAAVRAYLELKRRARL